MSTTARLANAYQEIQDTLFVWEYAGLGPKSRAYCPDPNCSGSRSKDTQLNDRTWHCYVCKKAGNVIQYAMEKNGLTWQAAIRELASHAGIPLEPVRERVDILQSVVGAAHQNLMGPCADKLEFWNKRGIQTSTLIRAGIGYVDAEGTCLEELDNASLLSVGVYAVSKQTGGVMTPLANRWVIPIREMKGDVVQLKLRADYSVLPEASPKSLALPRTTLFAPAAWGSYSHMNYLYFEDRIPKYTDDYVIVCEGEPDVLTLAQAGFQVVGLQTSQGIHNHAQKLSKFKKIYVLLDNDEASQKNIVMELFKLQLRLRDGSMVFNARIPRYGRKKTDVNEYFAELGKSRTDFQGVLSRSVSAYRIIIEEWAMQTADFDVLKNLGLLIRSAKPIHQDRMINLLVECSGYNKEFFQFITVPQRAVGT